MSREENASCTGRPIVTGKRSARIRGSNNPWATSSIPRIGDESVGASDHKKNEHPLQQAQVGVEKFHPMDLEGVKLYFDQRAEKFHPMDLEGVKLYFDQRKSRTGIHQSSNRLAKRKQDAPVHRVLSIAEPALTGYQSARSTGGSTSQAARDGQGIQWPLIQSRDVVIYRELIRPSFHDANEISHPWIFGAVAELLDNTVDEIPNGATKVLVDKVLNPCNGSPSLLVQDDGGGMDPDSLWKCMTDACPNRKPPNSIGQNGKGFRAAVRCLGASAIVFSRSMNTREPTQSIGLLTHVYGGRTCQKHIMVPMVHYKLDTMTGGIRIHEREPRQFFINMTMLVKLSPYNSEEKLLQNFNDIGPHGTKIIVFDLSRNAKGNLELDFDTDKKDIRTSVAPVPATNKAEVDQNHLVYHYRRSLRAYVSILYMGLPKHFRIILRGEEVKRRNLATELRRSQCITYKHSATEREQEMVVGFLDGSPNDKQDRVCIYNKQRLISPFVPFNDTRSERRQNVVLVLEANYLKPANNKQDNMWTPEFEELQATLKEKIREFWKRLKGKQIAAAEPSCRLSLGLHVSDDEANFTASNNTTEMHSQITPSDPAHSAAPTYQPNSGGMPSHGVPRAPAPPLPALSTPATRDREQRQRRHTTINSWNYASGSYASLHPAAPPLLSNGGGTSLQGIHRAAAPHLPTFAVATNSGDRRQMTMPAGTSSRSYYGMNFNTSSAFPTPPAYRPPPFSEPNCSGMPPNGVMRAPAPHLSALSMSATAVNRHRPVPASSVAPTATLHYTRRATTVNTTGLAPSHSVPPGAMVAPHDLPIKMEHDNLLTYGETAALLPDGMAPAAAGTAVGIPSAVQATNAAAAAPAPAVNDIGDNGIFALHHHRCPPGFKPKDATHGSASSSTQALHGGSNQGKQDLGKSVVAVKMEME
ncbi:hypothetical protein ACP70R_040401 [Stipagrostis hirtigluma subsp. patula]